MDTKLRTLGIKAFATACFISLSSTIFAFATWTVGSYVGTGAAHPISGIAFQPDFVFIKAATAFPAFVKTSTMASAVSRQYTSVTAGVTDAITALNPNGFGLGTNVNVNTLGVTYFFYAFKVGTSVKVGTYTGIGGGVNDITGVGKIEFALIFPEDGYGSSAIFSSGTAGGFAYDSRWKSGVSVNAAEATPPNPSFPATGFPTNSNAPFTNVSGVVYHWVGFIETANECIISAFNGDGSDDRDISTAGFKPSFIMTTNTNGGEMVLKGGNVTGDNSQYLNNLANISNLVQSVSIAGSNGSFQVGSNPDVNKSGQRQYYLAFGGAAGGVLPIELVHFDAQRTAIKQVSINWSTASEENNNYFTIERSENGNDFESIGQVIGAGNSTGRINYQFIDENAPPHLTVYYRIKQTDYDGMSKTFNVQAVSCSEVQKEFDVSIAQNPVTGNELQYDLVLPMDATMNVQILDNLGNAETTSNFYYSHGSNRYSLNTSTLKTGVYILNVTDLNGGAKKTIRFLVNK